MNNRVNEPTLENRLARMTERAERAEAKLDLYNIDRMWTADEKAIEIQRLRIRLKLQDEYR